MASVWTAEEVLGVALGQRLDRGVTVELDRGGLLHDRLLAIGDSHEGGVLVEGDRGLARRDGESVAVGIDGNLLRRLVDLVIVRLSLDASRVRAAVGGCIRVEVPARVNHVVDDAVLEERHATLDFGAIGVEGDEHLVGLIGVGLNAGNARERTLIVGCRRRCRRGHDRRKRRHHEGAGKHASRNTASSRTHPHRLGPVPILRMLHICRLSSRPGPKRRPPPAEGLRAGTDFQPVSSFCEGGIVATMRAVSVRNGLANGDMPSSSS